MPALLFPLTFQNPLPTPRQQIRRFGHLYFQSLFSRSIFVLSLIIQHKQINMKKVFFTVVSAGMLLTSCKKERTEPTPAPAEKRISAVKYVNSAGETMNDQYFYDSQGRISMIKGIDNTQYFTYESKQRFFMKSVRNHDTSIYRMHEYRLNNLGQAEKEIERYKDGSVYASTDYSYTTEGLLQTMITTYPAQNKSFRFEFATRDGVITEKRFYRDGIFDSREEYSYEEGLLFKGFNQLCWYVLSPGLYGTPMKHPLSGLKSYDAAGNLQWTRTYTTQFNSDGSCKQYTGLHPADNSFFTYSFEYQ